MPFLEKLNKPYPQILNKWRIIFIISLFISSFLLVFQPFGLLYIQIAHKGIIIIGYGFVTFIILVFNLIILPVTMPKTFNEDKWTIKRQIMWLCWIVISISVGNYFYSIVLAIFPWIGLKGFLLFIVFTLSIAIIPIIAVTYITQSIYLRNNLVASISINKQISQNNKIKEETHEEVSFIAGKQSFRYKTKDLIYIESEGNYINVWYLENSKVKSQLIRNTIKKIELKNNSSMLFKCHRAFIINLQHIEKVKGNSQGYKLVVKNIDKEIPVSRSYTKNFKNRMENF